MKDISFSSIDELYVRVLPALKSKCKELKNNGYSYILEIDIWNCIRSLKWVNDTELTLSDIVDDILNFSNKKIDDYCRTKTLKKNNIEIELPKLKGEF